MSYQLDRTVRVRQLLEAVQPIFVDPLPWRLLDCHNGDAVPNTTSEVEPKKAIGIRLEKAITFISVDMLSIGVYLLEISDQDLSEQSFASCKETITELLCFLDEQFEDVIFNHPLAQRKVRIYFASYYWDN